MTSAIIIQTTTDNEPWTTKLVQTLLENHLSADVQLSEIHSHYWWDGKINFKDETLLTIKTRADLFEMVEKTIRENSEYKVPQIIVTPIVNGGKDYLYWIDKETRK